MDFSDKVVIITGASAGIGATTALLFANYSAKVVLVGRNETALREIAAQCKESKGIEPLIIKADLTNDDDVKNIVTKAVEEFGKIDVLINCAGVGAIATIADGVEAYDKIMNTNVRSVFLLTSLATPHLIKSKGNIVNVSSIAGMKPIKHLKMLTYGMSKAAMDQFTRHVALELGTYGVRVNSVNPGATKTGFITTAGVNEAGVNDLGEYAKNVLPLGKITNPNEVADLIVYLAGDKARSITGSLFVIDNGELLL